MNRTIKQLLGLLLVFMMAFNSITPAKAATSEVDCLDTECLDHHDHGIDEHVEDVHSTCEDEHCVASTSSISKALAKKQAACNHTWTTVTTKQPTCGTSGTYVTKCSKCGAGSQNGNGYIPATGKHTWKVTSTTNATCTANGSKSYKCTVCGQTKTETINKLGHNWNRSAANCTTAKKCTRCGVVGQGALGHNWDRSAATCTADKKCTRCGSVGQAALGHNWDRSAATCTADKKCTRCGTVGQKATGHNYKQVTTKEPTCGASGTYVTKCTVCGAGAQNGNGYISPTGNHKWDRTAATCTADKKCTVCGTVGEAAKGHAWNLSAANCTTDMKCNRCGTINQKALGHNWDRSAATCTADKKCTRCGTVGQKATGHNYKQVTTKEPTCGTSGIYVTKCTVCGAGSQNGNGYISPTGNHKWDRTAATCTADKKCTVCGTVGETAKGHVWNISAANCTTDKKCTSCGTVEEKATGHDWNVSAATCTVDKKCTMCGVVGQKATGHNYQQVTTKEPTCGVSGTYVTKCSVCGAGSQNGNGYISPTGQHTWNVEKATCTVAKVCTVCGFESEAAKGHKGNWEVVVKPSCAGSGTEICICENCGEEIGYHSIQFYGDHDWVRDSEASSDIYDFYRCSNPDCKGTRTIEHNYEWVIVSNAHGCVSGEEVRKCQNPGCGKVIDGRTIQAYGDHTWQLLNESDKNDKTCTCTCAECGITITREHFYRKTVVREADFDNWGEYYFECAFCKDNYTEQVPPKVRTRVVYHWGKYVRDKYTDKIHKDPENYPETVIKYESLNDHLEALSNVPSSLASEDMRVIGWRTYEDKDTIYTDANTIGDVVTEMGEAIDLYAVWEKSYSYEFIYDASSQERKVQHQGDVQWEWNGRKGITPRNYVTFRYASANDDAEISIDGVPEWGHVEKDGYMFVFTCDPCYDVISGSETSNIFRRAQITVSVVDEWGRREKYIVALVQYRPKGYLDPNGNESDQEKLHQEYREFKEAKGALTEAEYFNTDGSNIRTSLASNGTDYFIIHRENPFCSVDKKKNIVSYDDMPLDDFDNMWLHFDVSYVRLSNEMEVQGRWVDSELCPNQLSTALCICAKKGDDGIDSVGFTFYDNNKNSTFSHIHAMYAQNHERPSAKRTVLLSACNLSGLALDIVSNIPGVPAAVTIPASALVGISTEIADYMTSDTRTTNELADGILSTLGETGVSAGIEITKDAVMKGFGAALTAKGIKEHSSGLKQALLDYFAPKSKDICFCEGLVYDNCAVIDLPTSTQLKGESYVIVRYYDKNEVSGHHWIEHAIINAYGEVYELDWTLETCTEYSHIWNIGESTCTTSKVCTICGMLKEDKKGHSWNLEQPTCTEAKECVRCGETVGRKADHKWDYQGVVEATNEEDRCKVFKCADCDAVYYEPILSSEENQNHENNSLSEYYDDNGVLYRIGEKLVPNCQYQINGYTYKTDSYGRIVSAEGYLRLEKTNGRRENVRGYEDQEYQNTDDRGHLIADRFGGSEHLENLVPMDATLNRSDYKTLENTLAKALENGSNDVFLSVELVYDGDSFRPSVFYATGRYNGVESYFNFANEREQQYGKLKDFSEYFR